MRILSALFAAACLLHAQGTVTKHSWTSRIFPGTVRDYWVYAPAASDPSRPLALMVFQDGAGFVNPDGAWKAPAVFDKLIAEKAIPAMIGVFIDPGVLPAPDDTRQARYNRSYEYDGMSDRYVRMLLEEILPEVAKTHRISSDPNDRGIAGSSSGAIAAFTAAWHRPDSFGRVLSFIGSYVNLRGGNAYSSLVRKMEPKPLRVFLQDGSNDLNIYSGSWWHANNDLASALQYAGYDMKFVTGTEGHNSKHGSIIFSDAFKWLWAEKVRKAGPDPKRERHYVTEILDPESDWAKSGTMGRQSSNRVRSADGGLILISNKNDRFVWSWQLDGNGKQTNGEPFYRLEEPEESGAQAGGMAVDTEGYLYVATSLGVQVCDQPGRVVAILRKPTAANLSNVWIEGNQLFAQSADGVFSRRIRRTGVPVGKPVKPPKPRL